MKSQLPGCLGKSRVGKSLKQGSTHSAQGPSTSPLSSLEADRVGQDGHPGFLPTLSFYEAVTCLKQVTSCDEKEVKYCSCGFSHMKIGRGH